MIISKTPFRISFAGGGSDLEAFYGREYGAVVSSSIDKYVYLAIHHYFEDRFLLKYSRSEVAESVDAIEHPLIRECLRFTQTRDFLEITSFADIPANGSGLGSSSAFSVGLVHALMTLRGKIPSKETCAHAACQIEIERLGEPIGKQDQYAAAYGGLNHIRFDSDGSVQVTPIPLPRSQRAALDERLLLFYTGITRRASSILSEQRRNLLDDDQRFRRMREIRDGADRLRDNLCDGNLDAIGEEMDRGWLLKREMAGGVSSPQLDDVYHRAREAGAIGGKLLGAGGGGFFLFYCDPAKQAALRASLGDLREVPFQLERGGTRIIFLED